MSFANIYTHRKVADTAAKGCDVCYRSTTSVLVAPENKDFFFVCPSHLKDRNFCAPIIDTAAVEAKKKKEMDEELERVKKEYEERQRKKKEKQDKEKSEEKDEDKDKSSQTEDKKSTDKKDDVEDKSKSDAAAEVPEEEPRVFSLQKNFFALRIEKKRQIELAKRNRERIAQPNFFPSVPKGAPNSG
ncbi:UPF0589 protein C32H8.01c like [Verticillium longisporum]|uniref:UPF0589 protein C32H8.01c like n=1 Tax=Verticillium longisporum TaxID=100787 RepID=A0A8I3ANZ5_VERLO|nr:UPF0589 protein C32H8.01c like [Verticillium longisporum]KAG7133087.1 UPF0589 protein C32H8.01c like [Verticillium longisporum]